MKERIKYLIRKCSKFAWKEMLLDVSRAEQKFGRTQNGDLKDWEEWNCIRRHLLEAKVGNKSLPWN